MKIVLLFLLLFAASTSHGEEREIFISLPVKKALHTLYISKIEGEKAKFQQEYLEELHQILLFDFSIDGRHSLLPYCSEKEKIIKSPLERHDQKIWKTLNVSHIIHCDVIEQKLALHIFLTDSQKVLSFSEIELTGDFNQDRLILHKLFDQAFERLFNERGIASTKILFAKEIASHAKNSQEWASEIWECDYDGANAKQLTYEKTFCISPMHCPNAEGKSKFFYVNYKYGQPKIFLSEQDASQGKRFIALSGNQLLPSISKNGDKIAFISDAAGRADLFMQYLSHNQPIGKPIQLYSFPRSVHASPTFSPEGDKIAFVSDKEGTPKIYILSLQKDFNQNVLPEVECITFLNRENTCPNWSPDGKKIAYSAKTEGIRQIWLYDVETKEERQLTHGPHHKENPSWARNSRHIVFNTADPTYSELYIMEVDSGGQRKISDGIGKKHYPAWKP